MAKTQIYLAALLLLSLVALYSLNYRPSNFSKQFQGWKTKYNKIYSQDEELYRMAIWLKNYQFIKEHNTRYYSGLETFQLEANAFADLANEEFRSRYLISFGKGDTSECRGAQAPVSNLPKQVDWASRGAVSDIKNQGQCGSCWAFSATGALQGLYFKKTQKLLNFSEQQLVDCSKQYGNNGCDGGLMNLSFFYVKDHGITTEDRYPYTPKAGKCRYNQSRDKVWSINDCTDVTVNNETILKGAIAQQPVSIAVDAGGLFFQFYRQGVFSGKCGNDLNHGVLAVGFGEMNGTKYYKVKNSWGPAWGMQGFIYILRNGDGDGWCGTQMAPSFPIVQ